MIAIFLYFALSLSFTFSLFLHSIRYLPLPCLSFFFSFFVLVLLLSFSFLLSNSLYLSFFSVSLALPYSTVFPLPAFPSLTSFLPLSLLFFPVPHFLLPTLSSTFFSPFPPLSPHHPPHYHVFSSLSLFLPLPFYTYLASYSFLFRHASCLPLKHKYRHKNNIYTITPLIFKVD